MPYYRGPMVDRMTVRQRMAIDRAWWCFAMHTCTEDYDLDFILVEGLWYRERGSRTYTEVRGFAEGNTVCLDTMTSWSEFCETLLHELAHVATQDDESGEEHSAAWGVAYAAMYELWESPDGPSYIPRRVAI